MTQREFDVEQIVNDVAQAAYRDEAGTPVRLDDTAASLGLLTYEGLGRLVTFLKDLVSRPPLANPIWQAHREVVEALISDIEKYRIPLYYDELHR